MFVFSSSLMHRNADVYRKSHHIKSSNIPFSSAALFPKLPLFANVYLSDGLVNCIGFQPSILGYLWKTYDTEDVPSVTGAVWWRGDWKSAIGYWSNQHQGHVRFNFNQTSRHKPLCSMKYTSNCCVEWNISPQNIMDYTLPFVSMKRQKYIEWC